MKAILTILIFFGLLLFSNIAFSHKISDPNQVAMKMIDETASFLGSKYDIISCGNGIDMDEQIEYLQISFHIFRKLPIDEARAMLFDCIDTFLEKINSDESIKPHLQDHPFTLKNVGIVFYISEKEYKDVLHPNICVARCSTSGVFFCTQDPENSYRYKDRIKETHEEALALVKKYRAEHPQ